MRGQYCALNYLHGVDSRYPMQDDFVNNLLNIYKLETNISFCDFYSKGWMKTKNCHLIIKYVSMRDICTIFLFVICFVKTIAQIDITLPHVVSGKIERISDFNSSYVTPRHIDIWLPNDYDTSRFYAVIYMHDGQMLFDSSQTWNKQAWDIDDIAALLNQDETLKPCIVVGIWNDNSTRHSDYFPKKPYDFLSSSDKLNVTEQLKTAGRISADFQPHSDAYLKFIVEELKPYIEKNYAVDGLMENTFIAGSSMGGLISWYALTEYPHLFGGAACLSTHWVGTFTKDNNPMPKAFIQYLNECIPKSEKHKLYFDCGDRTLDALYPDIQAEVDKVMLLHGYTNKLWMTQYYPGADHSENSWKSRIAIPLRFLLAQ